MRNSFPRHDAESFFVYFDGCWAWLLGDTQIYDTSCSCWQWHTHISLSNSSQRPGPTDFSAGVMTPCKNNLSNLCTLRCEQGGHLLHCGRQCTESSWTRMGIREKCGRLPWPGGLSLSALWGTESTNCCSFTDTRLSILRVTYFESLRWEEGPAGTALLLRESNWIRSRSTHMSACWPWSYRLASGQWRLAAATAYSISIALHLSRFFTTFIQVSLSLISLLFVSSVSSGFRKSYISSSHLFFFFGRPTVLFFRWLVLRLGFHFAAFFVHLSTGSAAIRHFILLYVSIQQGKIAVFILTIVKDVLPSYIQSNLLHQFHLCLCRSTALYSSSPRNRSTSSSVCKAGALVPPPSCLGGGPHGWVPVDTHSTPVPSSTGEAVGGLCSSRAQSTTGRCATRTVYLFICVCHEGNVAVLVAIGVRTASLCCFIIGTRFCGAGFSFLYLLFCLDDEAKHFALTRS